MELELDVSITDDTVFISASYGASGAEYEYESVEDIGKAVVDYLLMYYAKR